MSLARQSRHISIVGAGFGALATIRELTRLGVDAEITLIAPQAELHYLPGSIWIPSGLRRREDLLVPLESFFRRMGVRHVAAEASGLAAAGRRVITAAGNIENDALVIACGARFKKRKLVSI
jgi:sulfide:quinone oxidoreductase